MRKKFLKNMDWGILICSILLTFIGFVALFSATQNDNYVDLKKQIIFFLISIPVVIIVMSIDYTWITKISWVFYAIFILLLIGVFFTEPINGATSWYDLGFFTFQPAEMAKIFVILFEAYTICRIQKIDRKEINKPLKLLLVFIILALPLGLIILQPDYGTAAAFVVAFLFMLFTAGIDKKYIFVSIVLVAILLPLLYFYVLPEHAKTRIEVFLNPDLDPRGKGYNVLQSKLAIGAGQLFGMGLLKGNQTQLGFLYPKTTDFIFSVIGEEMGFMVAGAIIIIYVILITRTIYVAKTAKDDVGSYMAIGIAGVFTFHMLENIGMTMGLLPITGVPLLFVSYGGTSLITSFIMIGLLLNISGRRQKVIFME